jgi:hypothetical protein
VTGTDANKRYTDDLYDAVAGAVIDASKESYSSTFFKAQPGNQVYADIAALKLTALNSLLPAFIPQADSPLLGAASFTDGLLSSWFEKVNFVGAFATNNNWLEGWTEFDPQSAEY